MAIFDLFKKNKIQMQEKEMKNDNRFSNSEQTEKEKYLIAEIGRAINANNAPGKSILLSDDLDLNSLSYSCLVNIAVLYLNKGICNEALPIFLAARDKKNSIEVIEYISQCYLLTNKPADAKKFIEVEFSKNDERDFPLIFLQVCIVLGELDQAKRLLDGFVKNGKARSLDVYALGLALSLRQRNDEAIEVLECALDESLTSEEIYLLLAKLYAAIGDNDEAEYCYQTALDEFEESDQLLHGYGCYLFRIRRDELAKECFNRLLEKYPDNFSILNDFGSGLYHCGYIEEALVHYERSVQLYPESTIGLNNYAVTLREAGKFAKASEVMQEALRLSELNAGVDEYNKIDTDEIRLNQVMTDFDLGQNDDIEFVLSQAIGKSSKNYMAKWYRSLSRLTRGDLRGGWEDYHWRWESQDVPRRPFGFKMWNGDNLNEKQLLLAFSEQGIGDEIMFASCFNDLHRRSKNVVIECSSKLVKLYQRSFPWAEIIVKPSLNSDLPEADISNVTVQTPIGDLPKYFRVTKENFENKTPFLFAETSRINYWRNKLNEIGGGLKVGISWKGGTKKTRKILRSLELNDLLLLLEAVGITWVNIQYGEVEEELKELYETFNIKIHNFEEAIEDYDETAALLKSLDCVVSIQTAVVHLAGALGVEVHCLLPSAPEWRYRMGSDGSKKERAMLWYPTVNLYTQEKTGDWSDVVEAVRAKLEKNI